MADMLQVLSLMAVPALILGAIGYINRRGDRRFFEAEQARRSGAMVAVRHNG